MNFLNLDFLQISPQAIELIWNKVAFVSLLLMTVWHWIRLIYSLQFLPAVVGTIGIASANLSLTGLLGLRWIESGHFPLSNLYESLLFLAWGFTAFYLFIERFAKIQFVGVVIAPIALLITSFASFSLPKEMQRATALIPALQSNWLMMHVTVMMISYVTLLAGSLFAIAFLVVNWYTRQLETPDQMAPRPKGSYQPFAIANSVKNPIPLGTTQGSPSLHFVNKMVHKDGISNVMDKAFALPAMQLGGQRTPQVKSFGLKSQQVTALSSSLLKSPHVPAQQPLIVSTSSSNNVSKEGVTSQEAPIVSSKLQRPVFAFKNQVNDSVAPQKEKTESSYSSTYIENQDNSSLSVLPLFDNINSSLMFVSPSPTPVSTKMSTLAETLDNLSYRTLGLGFPLLTIGILSGAVWANEAWGSYWSWDPKETWAFITWLVFAIYLHTRLTKGWKGTGPALIAAGGFVVVWVCYLGVNLLGTGLHSYGWFQRS